MSPRTIQLPMRRLAPHAPVAEVSAALEVPQTLLGTLNTIGRRDDAVATASIQ